MRFRQRNGFESPPSGWIWIILVVAWLLQASAAVATECNLPADTTNRVGRAQTWIYKWTRQQYEALSGKQRDYVWQGAAAPGRLRLPDGVFTSAYIAVSRVPGHAYTIDQARSYHACGPTQDCTYAWLNTNHPSWIVRTHDQATPAWMFNDHTYIPVDISNPVVRQFRLKNEIEPLLSYGFQGISVDNVGERNDFDAEGVCSIGIPLGTDGAPLGDCASHGGLWTQIYQSPKLQPDPLYDDDLFTAHQAGWLRAIAARLHGQGACLSANVGYDPRNLKHKKAHDEAVKRLISAVDIWYYEPGFNGDADPSPCVVGGAGSAHAGLEWVNLVHFITGLKPTPHGIPMVQENSICPLNHVKRDVVQWVIGSNLMTKPAEGSHSYVAMFFSDGRAGNSAYDTDEMPGGDWPEWHWTHGPALDPLPVPINGLYIRRFAAGITICNPSSVEHGYQLEHHNYKGFDGRIYNGTITVAGPSCILLMREN